MANTQLSIANEALALIAKGEIQSLGENSLEAREVTRFLGPLLSEMSEWTEWPELIHYVVLASVTNDRPKEWLYAYSEPSDMADPIAIREADETTPSYLPKYIAPFTLPFQDELAVRFICEGGKIYTNVETATLVYTKDTLDVTQLRPLMRRALVDELASRLAVPLGKDPNAGRVLADKAEMNRLRAIADAQNRTQRVAPDYTSEAELARLGIGV